MNNVNSNLIELKCEICGAVGISQAGQIKDLRVRVTGMHLGHKLNEVPYVAVTDTAQNTAASLVQARGGLFVYYSENPS